MGTPTPHRHRHRQQHHRHSSESWNPSWSATLATGQATAQRCTAM